MLTRVLFFLSEQDRNKHQQFIHVIFPTLCGDISLFFLKESDSNGESWKKIRVQMLDLICACPIQYADIWCSRFDSEPILQPFFITLNVTRKSRYNLIMFKVRNFSVLCRTSQQQCVALRRSCKLGCIWGGAYRQYRNSF